VVSYYILVNISELQNTFKNEVSKCFVSLILLVFITITFQSLVSLGD